MLGYIPGHMGKGDHSERSRNDNVTLQKAARGAHEERKIAAPEQICVAGT